MVDVTVIVPCRNQGDTLERAVNSALALGVTEVLIFDDGNTLEDFDDSVFDYKPVEIFYNYYRVGVSVARNDLIERSHNNWIIPLDADDELLQIPPIPNDWRYWVYGGWIEHDTTTGHEEMFTAPPPRMIRQKPLCHATMMFSTTLWDVIGGYDPDFFYGEDYSLQCALYAANSNLAIHLDYPLYKRYVGNNQRTEKAKKYWSIIQEMAKEKWPSVFA